MSQDNVVLVTRAIEVFNRRGVDTLADMSQGDLEIASALTAAKLGESTYQGRTEAWIDYFAAVDQTWDGWGIEDADIRDAGNDRVACLCRLVE